MRASSLALLAVLAGCAHSGPPSNETSPAPASAPPPSATAEAPRAEASAAPATTPAKNELATPATPPPEASAAGPTPLPPGAVAPTEASTTADVRAGNGVALAMYSRARRVPGNVCLSGTSLRHALGVAYLGAKGETAKEMAKALALPSPEAAAGLGAQELDEWRKAKPAGGDLSIATRVWIDDTVAVAPSYLGLAIAYGAPAERIALASDPEKARSTMNAWVSDRTGGKITDLLGKGTLDARTRMLVTNAVYMKARWAEPFPKDATKNESFRVEGRTPAQVPTMHLTAQLRYAAADANKLVELRYDGTPLAMLLVVPDDPAGVARAEQALSVDTLEKWTKGLTQRKVALSMPRFSFTAGGSLNDTLRDMGIRTAFSDRADFGGIVAGEKAQKLNVSQVVQRTFLAVDEVGTEAAAATGVVMRTTSLDMSAPVDVKIDRPFLFVLRDVTRGRILFVGRVSDPR